MLSPRKIWIIVAALAALVRVSPAVTADLRGAQGGERGANGAVLLAQSGKVSPPTVVDFARAALEDARHWQADARLVAIAVQNWSQYPYAVATGHPYDYGLTFVSPQSRLALLTSYAASYTDQVASADRIFKLPLPDRFIDLPAALERAQRDGMNGPMDHALLAVWQPRGRPAVAAWVIAPQRFNPNHPVEIVEATTGRILAPNEISDGVPGSDAQIARAFEAMRQALTPPPPPAVTQQPGAAPGPGCISCAIRAGQARQYIINHPAASMGQAYAATTH